MKILAINGSPNRNGSTSKLIDMILSACKEAGAECEKIHLEDYVIGQCTGCIKFLKDCEYCKDDDFIQLKAKMLEADGIVVGSPYYSGKPTVQLKTFIDRLAYTSAYNKSFSDKYTVGVSTSAVNSAKKIAKYCASLGHISFMGNGTISGLIYESTVDKVVLGDLADNAEIKERASMAARKLISDIKHKRRTDFYHFKRLIFRKWVKILCIKILRGFDKIKNSIRRFMTDKGWIKRINKIED